MDTEVSKAVSQYVGSLNLDNREFAFFGLDGDNCITRIGGSVDQLGFSNVKLGQTAESQLSFLEGLLSGDNKPIVIPNAQYLENRFVDLHLFFDANQPWLLFVDNTEVGVGLQKAQQVRLDQDILEESPQSELGSPADDEQHKYWIATEKLFTAFSGSDQDIDEKINNILNIGLEYFQSSCAFLTSDMGENFTVTNIVGNGVQLLEPGEVINADIKNKIRASAASEVHTVNGPFGCVCFLNENKLAYSLSATDEKFLIAVSGWIGNLLGTKEQLEFIEAQSANYKNLFESVPAMLFLCDAEGLVISVSQQFALQVGLAQDEVPGKICLQFFDSDNHGAIRNAISTGEALHVAAKLNCNHSKALEVELNVSEKKFGAMSGIRMVIATDVSARNQAYREATEQNRLLASANESLDQFAFVASHDLQEPLRKIQQFSSFLEEDLEPNLDVDGRYHLEVIVKASEKMSALIKDLLSFSRAKKAQPDFHLVDLNNLLTEVMTELDLAISESGAEVKFNALPVVQANGSLLSQLFNNLIGNAIKYRKPDCQPVINVTCNAVESGTQICVSDNGIGFDMQYANKIFEPFSRLHNSIQYEGTGIGLAICHAACEKHGWSLTAKGEVGVGSTFIVELNDA